MIVPASRFSTLPEGCPVRFRSANLPGTVREPVGNGYRVEVANAALMPGGVRDSTLAGPAHLDVDLTTPAAVRAFAPELIAAVRGLAHPLECPPAALWVARAGHWVLVERVGLDGTLKVCRAATGVVTGPTPAACLLAGLQAALDAAKDAQ